MYLESLVQMSILQKAVDVPGFFLSFSKETNTLLYARNSQKKLREQLWYIQEYLRVLLFPPTQMYIPLFSHLFLFQRK